jgi:hypothetical protein
VEFQSGLGARAHRLERGASGRPALSG